MQFRVICRPASREYREQSPGFETKADKILLQLRKLRQAAFVDTGHHVELDFPGINHHLDGPGRFLKRTGAPSHPVVDISESVETDGHCPEAACQKTPVSLRSKGKPVGDHSPRESAFIDCASAGFQVFPYKGFSTSDIDHHLVRIILPGYGVKSLAEILHRHILDQGLDTAVAAAVPA